MIKPAAEGGGQPIRGRGVALERGVAGTGPASGGVRGEALPSEALQAPLGRTASLGPTAFFSVREVGGRGGRGRPALHHVSTVASVLGRIGCGSSSDSVGKCVIIVLYMRSSVDRDGISHSPCGLGRSVKEHALTNGF